MFRHVVMMSFSDELTKEGLDAIVAGLRGLPERVPEIRAYSVGLDAGLAEGNSTLVLVGDFDDVAGYESYATNADHLDVIATLIRPFVAERHAVQHHID